MGLSLKCECQKCGYAYEADIGVGLIYPRTYCETITKVKNGQFGEQGKEFFEAFPDGAISCEAIVVQCNDCGQLMKVPELSLYIPKEGYNPKNQARRIPWSTVFSGNDYKYVSFSELDNHYQLFEKYDQRCLKCNGHTSIVTGFTECMDKNIDRTVRCPKCGTILKIEISGIWD